VQFRLAGGRFKQGAAGDYPPAEASSDDLTAWAKARNLKFLGEGINRRAYLLPDGKVFKVELRGNPSDPDSHNTDTQVYVYHNEKPQFFPKLYAYGNNWVVEERVSPVTELLGMNRYAWNEAARALASCDSEYEVDELAGENYFVGKLWRDKKVRALIEMFLRNGLDLAELRLDNLGKRSNGQVVVLDYERPV
jgi:hypothetical protein